MRKIIRGMIVIICIVIMMVTGYKTYNYLSKKIEQENSEHINEMLDYLNYLGDLKSYMGR